MISRAAVIALVAALCATVLKKQVPELGLVLALCAGALILSMAMDALVEVRSFLDTLADTGGLSPAVLGPVIKTVGIAIVTQMAQAVCRDAGEGGLASFVEMAGVVAALYVCLPLMQAVLETLRQLL
ncbi:MAG: SpoIIIAC/SpoIIIAD family protein [Oscillospiraceae bacterium]